MEFIIFNNVPSNPSVQMNSRRNPIFSTIVLHFLNKVTVKLGEHKV